MDLKHSFSYHRRLFLLLLGFSWTLVGCFVAFQYGREKRFKAERFDARLQALNLRILHALHDGESPEAIAGALRTTALPDLRMTLLDTAGHVRFDSSADSLTTNHLDRPEIAAALSSGSGCTIRRHSQSTDLTCFYSATRSDSLIVRTAAPYTVSLTEMLAADRGFLWFMFGIALSMSVAAYFATRRLGHNITRLDDFARRAERGERIDDDEAFPNDELGSISNHIIRLYARLQRTTADRDREHAAALHEEQEKIRIKKQLTNNINHELKTPVAAIQGYLETLLAHPGMPEAHRMAFLEKSREQSERLRSLLTDVATLTRMDEAGWLIGREPVVLNDLIDEIAADMALRPDGRRMRIDCDFPGRIEVMGNPSLLGSVFRNLTDNAVAYSGGTTITIRLEEDGPERCTILFADDGAGVAEEHLPHLFERFYRVDKGRSRKLGGTGLGLSIVKNAVLLHGGTISVRNREQGGLEFRFSLSRRG